MLHIFCGINFWDIHRRCCHVDCLLLQGKQRSICGYMIVTHEERLLWKTRISQNGIVLHKTVLTVSEVSSVMVRKRWEDSIGQDKRIQQITFVWVGAGDCRRNLFDDRGHQIQSCSLWTDGVRWGTSIRMRFSCSSICMAQILEYELSNSENKMYVRRLIDAYVIGFFVGRAHVYTDSRKPWRNCPRLWELSGECVVMHPLKPRPVCFRGGLLLSLRHRFVILKGIGSLAQTSRIYQEGSCWLKSCTQKELTKEHDGGLIRVSESSANRSGGWKEQVPVVSSMQDKNWPTLVLCNQNKTERDRLPQSQ